MRLALALSLVVACGCTSQAKKNQQALARARADFDAAMAALKANDLDAAHVKYGEMEAAMFKLRATTAPPMSEDVGEGPVVLGQTAKSWQTQWERSFKDGIELQLPELLARARAGTLDWSRGRSFLTTYRRDLDSKWVEVVQDAAQAEVQGHADELHFMCSFGDRAMCDRLRDLLAPKFTARLDDRVLLESSADAAMAGRVEVTISFDGFRQYAQVTDPRKNQVFSLPEVLEVHVTLTNRRGRSNWDGESVFRVRVEPPEAINGSDLSATETRHDDALFAALKQQLAEKPAQKME